MRRIRSLGNKVALLFFLITAAAFGVIYFWVVTQPESSLEERRLQDLELVADASTRSLERLQVGDSGQRDLDKQVRALAESTDARVTVLTVREDFEGRQLDRRGLSFLPRTDSGARLGDPRAYDLARRAVRSGEQQSGLGSFQGEDIGIVAQPLPKQNPEWVAVFSRDFAEVAETVSFIRDRVLWATGAALLIALVGGWFVAHRLSRRVRRVERAAADVARGHFKEPLPVDSEDELGQLTRTFNDMQRQLREVDIARKEFIATASHELRTPIFSLAGFVELLQDEDLDAETRREFIDTMSEQVARLQKLSVDLLDLSRLDSGAMELQPEHVDLAELTRSVVGEFRPALSDHGTNVLMRGPRRRAAGQLRPRAGGPDHAYPPRQRPAAYPRGHRRHRERAPRQRGRRAHGGRLRPRASARVAREGLRALLHRRRRPGSGPRARHRARARRAHGRAAHARLPATAAPRSSCACPPDGNIS